MLLGVGVQADRWGAADRHSAQGRLFEAGYAAERPLSRRRAISACRQCSRLPLTPPRASRCGRRRAIRRWPSVSRRRSTAAILPRIGTFPMPSVAAEIAASAGADRALARAAIDDVAIKDALKREVDSAIAPRCVRIAIRLRRRRAILGDSIDSTRSSAGSRPEHFRAHDVDRIEPHPFPGRRLRSGAAFLSRRAGIEARRRRARRLCRVRHARCAPRVLQGRISCRPSSAPRSRRCAGDDAIVCLRVENSRRRRDVA